MAINPYSAGKAARFPLHLLELRQGKQPYPVHVQLILSDLCNHGCPWCLVAGTLIDTPIGLVPIENISKGMEVYGPTGRCNEVTEARNRIVSEVLEVTIGNTIIRCTGEHPILTQDGWKEAGQCTAGRDAAAMCVRMQPTMPVESTIQEMGSVFVWPSALSESDTVQSESCHDAQDCARGAGSALQMRLRATGDEISEAAGMDGLCAISPEHRQNGTNDSRMPCKSQRKNASSKPDEAKGNCREGCSGYERSSGTSHSRRLKEHCRCRETENAFAKEPNERSGNSSQGDGEVAFTQREIEKRDSFRELANSQQHSANIYWQRNHVGWEKEPRFPSTKSKESCGGEPKSDFHESVKCKNRRQLRHAGNQEIQKQELAMPSGIQKRASPEHSTGAFASDSGFHIARVKVERGLEFQPITDIRRLRGVFTVYNFSCTPDESYVANGVVVHNCSYRQDGNISNQLFGVVKSDGSINNNPNRQIPTAKVHEILQDCKAMGVRAIQLTGGGEPTIHPDFKIICREVLDLGMNLALVSNGVKIDEDAAAILMKASWIRISIDAGSSHTYQKIRRVSHDHFQRAWDNIRTLARMKRESDSQVYLGVGFVVQKENWREVLHAARQAKDAGVDSFRISAAFLKEGSHYFDGFGEEADSFCQMAEGLADDTFSVVNMFRNRLKDLEQGRPDYQFCGYQNYTTYIGGDLNVYRCCSTAYNERGLIGSLACQGFKELWDSEAKQKDFAGFDAHGCERCQFHDKNKQIASLMAEPVSHETFV